MNRWMSASPALIVFLMMALPVLVVHVIQGAASHNSRETLCAGASHIMMNKVSTPNSQSQSMPLILAAIDDQDTNCHDKRVCGGR